MVNSVTMNVVSKLAFPTWPCFADDEIEKVTEVLSSGRVNYWTGDEGKQFEKAYAAAVGTEYAIALMNGTVALEAALQALNIGPGDEVITSCRTFIASASCIVRCGAIPVLADINSVTQNIDAETIEKVLTPKTKAIIVVHLGGWPCDMAEIMAFANARGLYVIEDCAQAHGATYQSRQVGAWGHIAAFSFCQDKIITTGGEGGMITTNDKEVWQKIWSLKDHGKDYDAVHDKNHPPGFRWLHHSFGTNWRMTEIQAAIGRLQLKKLPQWLAMRRRHAEILTQHFKEIPGLRITEPDKQKYEHSYYRYYVFLNTDKLKSNWDRDTVLQAMSAKGIPCFSGTCGEIYREKAFVDNGWSPKIRYPVAKQLAEQSLAFLVHPTLTENHIHQVADIVKTIVTSAMK